ncbi:hypothetical protein AgCh_036577 [Apium graveolens]
MVSYASVILLLHVKKFGKKVQWIQGGVSLDVATTWTQAKSATFLWADPPYSDRAREVIKELKGKIRGKYEEVQKSMMELSFVEKKMLVLNEECISLQKRNDEVEAILRKEKQSNKMKKLLVIVVIAWINFGLFN